ncbi:abortive infection family protein [Mammaliicoccus sciuri]|nr:abortive infection family protein [Mammaliicoccus sciuri]
MVKTELKMKNNRDYDKRINELLSGLNKINDAIGKMRNENSDSHGVVLRE